MIKHFIKENFFFLLVSLAFLGLLIVTDFVWDKTYLKYGALGMWALNAGIFVMYNRRIRQKAKQCSVCGLFIPLDNTNSPQPHCCYQKPKDIR